MNRPYKNVETKKLKFILGVGEAGLRIWKGKKLAEVKRQCDALREEIRLRGEEK